MAKAQAKKDDNVVELRKNGPAEDAVVALQLGKIARAKAEFETANGNYRNTLKHVEAKGIHLAAAKDALAIKKSGKVDEKVAYLKALTEYLMILGTPIEKKQLDMFRVETPSRDSTAKAKDQNPYAVDSEQGQAWISAFHDGTRERELILSMEPAGDELIKSDADDDVFDEDED
jgi:hypothetical protein